MKRIRRIDLQDVIVSSTKVKFYFKNDTLIYNADAFVTQNGFVLNDILKKMPGIVIKPNGEIEANGRKVQALLLNGKDFFNSDRKTLLENMPAFMVKDVRLYDKSKDSTSLIKREREFEGYVMDVKLKKEYQSFFLGNSELGYGTKGRYYSKLFGLKYNSISKVHAYATANNVNKDETITDEGHAINHSNGDGDKRNAKAGISYNLDHLKGIYALKGDAEVDYHDDFTETRVMGQNFFTDGNIHYRQLEQTKNYLLTAKTNHSLYFFGNTPWDFSINPSFSYEKVKGRNMSVNNTFNHDVDDLWGRKWADSLMSVQQTQAMRLYGINGQSLHSKKDAYAWQSQVELSKSLQIPHTEDILLFTAKYRYHKVATEQFTRNDITNKTTGETHLHKYSDAGSNDREINVASTYTYKLTRYNSLAMTYDFSQLSLHNHQPMYSLHELAGWDAQSHPCLGWLPSQEELLKAIDYKNTYSYAQRDRVHKMELGYRYSKTALHKITEFSLKIPYAIEDRKLDFHQQSNDTIIHRKNNTPLFVLNFSNQVISHDHGVWLYSFQYDYREVMPSLYNLVNIKNDVNPLYVVSGNPNLKDARSHHAFGQLFWQNQRFYIHRMNITYNQTNNQIANSVLFNRQSGVTYITPRNVNGNWSFTLNFANSLYVKRNRLVSFNNDVNLTWQNCADYVSADMSTFDVKGTVKNFSVTDRLQFTCYTDNTKYGMNGFMNVNYSMANSDQDNFRKKDLVNYGLQANLSAELPHDILLQSSILTVCRRGYNFSDMDDEEYIWSAHVTKKFGEKFSLSLELYDILGQRKSVYHYLDAQGCRDIFYNNMKRYAMLSFVYRLNPSCNQKKTM